MEKLLAMILALALVLSLAACGQSAPEESKEGTKKEQSAVTASIMVYRNILPVKTMNL